MILGGMFDGISGASFGLPEAQIMDEGIGPSLPHIGIGCQVEAGVEV